MSEAWIVVPNLEEANAQLTKRFPKRSHASDGGIGNAAHAASTSSHNPDKTGNAEYKDGDAKNEVRARDYDKNLNSTDGVVMEDVVQLWVKLARAGVLWWVRYIIYNGRIWHKRDGFVTRKYTGASQHKEHVHVTSDFTQKADEVTGTNWHLNDLGVKAPATPAKPAALKVDGMLGPKTVKRWQQVLGEKQTGKMSKAFIEAVQKRLRQKIDKNLKADGILGPKTIGRLQSYLKSPVDGHISKPVSEVVKALQRRLNTGSF